MRYFSQLIAVALVSTLAAASPQATNIPISVSNAGAFGNNSSFQSQLSDDGRFVVFDSFSDNLVAGDTNGFSDVFRRDTDSGVTELISVAVAGSSSVSGSGLSLNPDVSADGNLVVWASQAFDLVTGDINGTWDIFLRDLTTGVTTRLTDGGTASATSGEAPRMSPDGRFLVFETEAPFAPQDTNGQRDIYRLDRQSGAFTLVSVSASGTLANGACTQPDISDDGSRVVFTSTASNFAADTNGLRDIFVKDLNTGSLELISRNASNAAGNDESQLARISGNGRIVVFNSRASDLLTPDTNSNYDIYARDLTTGTLERINARPDGSQPGGFSRSPLTISRDGDRLVFTSVSSDLVAGDTNGAQDVFLRVRSTSTTTRITESALGGELFEDSFVPSMTDDGRVIAFASDGSNVTAGDPLGERQIYAAIQYPTGGFGTTYCFSNPNSTGETATMLAVGSPAVADNALTLIADELPRFSFGFFLTSRTTGFSPSGNAGILCLGSSIGRYVGPGEVQNSGGSGRISLDLDLTAIPQPNGFVTGIAGEVWHFQAWYRDSAGGSPISNFTNGYSVMLR